MEDKKKSFSIPHMGASLLLVTFLILCLLMFATLTVTSARSNYLLAQRSADRQTNYYAAANAAQEVLEVVAEGDVIESALAETADRTADGNASEAGSDSMAGTIADGNVSEMDSDSADDGSDAFFTVDSSMGDVTISLEYDDAGHMLLSWEIPFTDTQALAVTIDIPDASNTRDYTVTQWQTISTEDWTATQTITLLTPES